MFNLLHSICAHNMLFLHGFLPTSHELALHHLTEKLVSRYGFQVICNSLKYVPRAEIETNVFVNTFRGHRVTTVRVEGARPNRLKPLGPNFTDVVLRLNNSDGWVPWCAEGEHAVVTLPGELLWRSGHSQIRMVGVQLTYEFMNFINAHSDDDTGLV